MTLLSKYYHALFSYNDTDLIQAALNRSHGPLLDLGCATGRVLEVANNFGYAAYGIDSSAEMINNCKLRLNSKNYNLIQGDFKKEQSQLFNKIGTVSCVANTFSMITNRNERIETLKNAKKYLKTNGNILIYIKSENTEPNRSIVKNIVVENTSVDFSMTISENSRSKLRTFDIKLIADGVHENHTFHTSIISLNEINAEFVEAGLDVYTSYGNFDLSPMETNSPIYAFILVQINAQL